LFLGPFEVGEARPPAELVHPAAVRLRDAPEPIVVVAQGVDLRLARTFDRDGLREPAVRYADVRRASDYRYATGDARCPFV
jgi:hypothetical protein